MLHLCDTFPELEIRLQVRGNEDFCNNNEDFCNKNEDFVLKMLNSVLKMVGSGCSPSARPGTSSRRRVSKNDEFWIENEEWCTENEGFCIQNVEFCRPQRARDPRAEAPRDAPLRVDAGAALPHVSITFSSRFHHVSPLLDLL